MAPIERGVHPVCAMFPILGDRDPAFIELAGSIEVHGLIDAIVLDREGRILDGRHRLRACELADIEPRFINFEDLKFDGVEGDFVFARNLCRRDLTDDQRAALIAEYEAYLKQTRSDVAKKKPRKPQGTFDPCGKKPQTTKRKALQEQAKVSERKARQAIDVAQHAPELLPAVKTGEVKLRDAHKTATERKSKTAKPRPFDLERFVDQVDASLRKKFAKCPREFIPKLKERVIAIVKDQ